MDKAGILPKFNLAINFYMPKVSFVICRKSFISRQKKGRSTMRCGLADIQLICRVLSRTSRDTGRIS
jgi:hypothetical protein